MSSTGRAESARTAALVLAVLGHRRALRRRDGWTREQLGHHQTRALSTLRRYAYVHSPFYRRFHAGSTDRPLDALPVLTKAMLMDNFDDLVTTRKIRLEPLQRYLSTLAGNELFDDRYYVSATAGTTGRRGIFAWNFREWVQVIASYNRAFDWSGSSAGLLHTVKTAVVSSTNPSHQSARVGASIHSRWVPTLRLDSTDPVDSIVDRLNAWQPQLLIGYASMLRLLAEEQLAGHLRIAPGFVFSASEVLTDSTRSLAVAAWSSHPYNVYGATETSGIAAECGRHQGMHLFEDLVITEIVDEAYRPVPDGTYGAKILVTVLFSRTLPLIRYEITDSVQAAPGHGCPCGRPYRLITGVQGRLQEVLRFDTPTGPVTIQPLVFHHLLDAVDAAGWQVRQQPGGVDVLLARPRPDTIDVAQLGADLAAALVIQGVPSPAVQVRPVDAIPRTALGKAPLIVGAEHL